jgi:hypothetical protein
MPELPMILGQSTPGAAANTALYTVPAATYAIVSSLIIADRGVGTLAYIRVAIRPGGAGLANQHYIVYDKPLPYSGMYEFTSGISLGPGDVITVRNSLANAVFGAYGMQITTPRQGTPGVLGQSAPGAAAWTSLYAVPALTSAVVSSIFICNRAAATDYVIIAVIPSGGGVAPPAASTYITAHTPLGGNETYVQTSGIGLETGDMMYAYSTNGTSSFSVFGAEIT